MKETCPYVSHPLLYRQDVAHTISSLAQFTYNHDEYWPTLLQASLDRREALKESWKALGGGVGSSELDIKTRALEGQAPNLNGNQS